MKNADHNNIQIGAETVPWARTAPSTVEFWSRLQLFSTTDTAQT